MKKITLGVIALSMTIMSFGQNKVTIVDDLQEQNFKIDEVIDAIRMDMYYGHLEKSRGMFYVNQMIEIKRDNEINIVILTRLENE
jgi:hypothetical protein|tara:strand:- start:371 stop:625 length:255 start_codon:yes stop_codon:yes gene_type:complete